MDRLTLDALAQVPPWPVDKVRALNANVRGALLKDWGVHVARRWGRPALATLRDDLALDAATLPEAPERKAWFPVAHQLLITRYVADTFAAGDLVGLEGLITQDSQGSAGQAVTRWAARRVGTRRVIKSAPKLHAEGYDLGGVEVDVGRGHALLQFRGAPFFGAPTWRVLQLFALRGLARYMGDTVVSCWGSDVGPEAFDVGMRWR